MPACSLAFDARLLLDFHACLLSRLLLMLVVLLPCLLACLFACLLFSFGMLLHILLIRKHMSAQSHNLVIQPFEHGGHSHVTGREDSTRRGASQSIFIPQSRCVLDYWLHTLVIPLFTGRAFTVALHNMFVMTWLDVCSAKYWRLMSGPEGCTVLF